MCILFLAISALTICCIGGLVWFFSPVWKCYGRKYTSTVSEENFAYGFGQSKKPFSSILAKPTVYISVVIPAYNEADRLPQALDEMVFYLEQRQKADRKFTYEIIIVDDGSTDQTCAVSSKLSKKYGDGKILICKLAENNGKGGAVRKGVLRASGTYILMADADGASDIKDLAKLERCIEASPGKDGTDEVTIAIGSRAHLQDEAIATRAWYRNITMHAFHFFVNFLCPTGVRDTQCGFKLFSRRAAQLLFLPMHIERWAFDVELLYLGKQIKATMEEVPIRWTEIPGSKLNIVTASITMLRELMLIRLCYLTGIWKVSDVHKCKMPSE